MNKFIQKFAAMIISIILCIVNIMPTFAATTQDYVPTIDLSNGISLLSDTTGSAIDYPANGNGMTIVVVDQNYEVLDQYDTTPLVVGNMGGVKAPTTKNYNGNNYNFSHYEYATSVRNYVASYNSEFQFYVDPPMTILAVYTTGTPNPPSGPIVGMYKDPEVKDGKTFYYLNETAQSGDISNVRANITFGRSAKDQTAANNEETFSTQAANIYKQTNNIQFIVASAIVTGGPINFTATAPATTANAQIKMWNFSTEAFADNKTSVNGITLSNASASSAAQITAGDGKIFTKGLNTSAAFNVNMGDVVKVYNDGTNVTATNGTVKSTGTNLTTIVANSTGSMTVSGGYIYAVSVNMYASVGGGTDISDGGEETPFSYVFLQDNQDECTSWLGVGDGTVNSSFATGRQGSFKEPIFNDGTVNSANGQTGISYGSKGEFTITTTGDNQTLTLYMLRNGSGTSTVKITGPGTPDPTQFVVQNRDAANQDAFVVTLPTAGTYTFNASSSGTMLFKAILSGTTGGGGTTIQKGSVYGIITDAQTHNAISGATVTLSTGATTTTDITGSYSFGGLDVNKTYTVTASKTGYNNNSATTASLTTAGIKQDIELTKQAEQPTTITQTFNITPNNQSVTINGQSVTNGGKLTLDKNTNYTITPPTGFTVNPTSFTTGDSDGTTNITLTSTAPTTVNATVSVNPTTAKIKINGTEYSNGDKVELTIDESYEVTASDTTKYNVSTVNGASTSTFIATSGTTSVNVVLSEITVVDEYVDVVASGDLINGLVYDFTNSAYNGKKAHATGAQAANAVYGNLDTTDNYIMYSTTDGLTVTDNSSSSNAANIPLGTTINSGTVTITGNIKLSSDCTNAINIIRFGASGVGIRYNSSTKKIILSDNSTYSSDSISYTVGNDIEFTWTIDIDNKKATLTIGSNTIEQNFTTAQSSDLLVLNTGSTATFDTSCKNLTIKTGSSVVVPTTVTQTFNITPNNQSVTINGQSVANGGKLTLNKNTTYTITPPSGYTVSPATFTTGDSDDTTYITLTEETVPETKGTISGKVTNANDSSAIANAIVKLFIGTTEQGKSATTDASGNYSLADVLFGNSYILKFSANGFNAGQLNVNNFNADKIDANIALTPTSTPVQQTEFAKFYVNEDDATANGDDINNNATSIFTDAIKAANSLSSPSPVTIEGENYSFSKRTGNSAHKLTIVVPDGVTDATLYVYGNSSGATSTRTLSLTGSTQTGSATGSGGTLSKFTGLSTGTYTLSANGNWGYSFLGLVYTTGPATTGNATITVTNQNGVAITDASVTASGITFTNEGNGTYTAKKIEPGTYTITVSKNGVTQTVDATITVGTTYTNTVVLKFNNGTITVKVTDGSNPITNATVTANGLTFTNSGNGDYIATGVVDGTYDIAVSNGTDTKNVSVTVSSSSSETVTVSFMDTHDEAKTKMQEYLNIILARDVSQPKWNTESSRFNTNNWHYVNGAMETALLDMYEVTGETKYKDFAVDSIKLKIGSSGSISGISGYTGASSQLDGVREMSDFDRLYKLTGDSRYNKAADYVYTNIIEQMDRITSSEDSNAVDSFSHKTKDYKNQIWLDGFFMAFPYYMQYGVNNNDTTMITDVYNQYKNLYNVDRDSTTGLYYHGYNGGTSNITIGSVTWSAHSHTQSFWLRAMAWLAMSYADTLEIMPEGTQKEDMKKWFKEYMTSVINYQDSNTGMWRQVVDAGDVTITKNGNTYDNYFETSGSSGMAAALLKGYRLGYLDDVKYLNAGLKAFDGICENKLYYSDSATSDIYESTVSSKRLDWITPWQVTSSNNSGSANTGKYMILKDICRVAGITGTSSTNQNNTINRDGTRDYYLQEFRVDNDGKAIAPLVRAYSEVLLYENGNVKKAEIK